MGVDLRCVPRQYKIRMPVLQRLCRNCRLEYGQHVDGKCLFEPTAYVPGEIKTERKTVKANIDAKDADGDERSDS